MTKQTNTGRDRKRATIYMPKMVHERLRELAYVRRVSQQHLLREAIDMLFEAEGIETWEKLENTEFKLKT